MIKVITHLFLLIILGCTAGGDTAFTPEDTITIDDNEEAQFEAVIDSVIVTPGNYRTSQAMTFTVKTLKRALITGSPFINFDISGSNFTAIYSGSTDAYSHNFTYTVTSGLLDLDGIVLSSPLDLNGGSFKDILDTDFTLTFTPPSGASVLVDSISPNLLSVSKPADGLYIVGDQLNFVANFDENVNVSGLPRIPISINSGTAYANYLSGSGTSTLTFQLIVNPGNDDNDGIVLSSSLDLNGGSINDSFGNGSSFRFTPPNTTGITLQPYGNPIKLAFTTQPSTPNTRNIDFATQPIVAVQDSLNGTVLNATDTITLLPFTDSSCTTPAGGILSSNTLAATTGIASFLGLDYNSLGSIYIRASAPGLTSACSDPVLVQLLPPTKIVFSTYPGTAANAGINFSTQPIVQVQDVTSSVVTTASNSVTITAFTDSSCSTPASGVLSNTTQTASSGIATFSGMNYTVAETIYLQASSSGLTSDCEAVAINVAPGADSVVEFTTYPGNSAVAGNDFAVQPIVRIKDAFNNLTTSTATISLSAFTNSTCTLSASGTLNSNSIAAVSGTATFSGVDYTQAETIYLRASSGALTADCEPVAINVSTAGAIKVAFSTYPGSSADAGSNFPTQPIVEIRDIFDNVVNSTDTINLAAFTNSTCTVAAPGVLASSSISAVAGVATFSEVNYNQVATIYLRASSGALTSDCEPIAINVGPAAPAKVIFTSYPGTTASAGIDFGTQPIVQIRDGLDNLTTSTDTVTINAFTDSTCSTAASGTLNSNSIAAVSGTATFSGMDYTKAEIIYLEASSGALTSDCEAVAINVSPGSASKVSFTTYPGAAAVAGVDFAVQPVVEIRDAFDNLVSLTATVSLDAYTNSTCTIVGSGTLNSNSISAVAGVATFTGVDYTAAETIYLRASSGALNVDCEAVAINVSPNIASKVTFTSYPGAAAVAGIDFPVQPVVEIRDAFDNTVSSTGTVNLSAFTNSTCTLAAGGTLNSNSIAAVAGIATFSGMDYNIAETIYLRASSGVLTVDCQPVAINVSPGAAAKVVFTTYPGSPYNEDTDFAIQPIVEIRDTFENLVPSTATVTIDAFTNGTCTVAAGGTLNSNSISAVTGVATFSGMDYDTPEMIYLRASSGGLTSDCENTAIAINDITPPGDPTGLSLGGITWVTGASPDSPLITWTNPGDADFDHAELALGTSVGATNIVAFEDADALSSHDFNSLSLTECSVTYYPTVRAVDSSGNTSNNVNLMTGFQYDNTVPGAPPISFVFNDHNATESSNIYWDFVSDNCAIDHFEMAVSTTASEAGIIPGGGWTNTGTARTAQLTGLTLTLGTTYYSLVKTVDTAGLESAISVSPSWTYVLPPDAITDLAVGQADSNQVELSWTEPNDNGSPITDYVVEFRESPAGSWTVFNDGINTDRNLFVTGLTASTEYDFRVKATNGSGSTDSNIATAETLPDNPFFDGLKAFNLGGAIDSTIVSLVDNNEIKLNGVVIVSDLDKGQTHNFVSAQNDVIEGSAEFYVAGRAGSTAGCGGSGNIVWSIKDWAGKNFIFDGTRNGPHNLIVRAFEATTVEIYRDGALFDSQSIAADTNHTFVIAPNDQYEVISTGIIAAYVYSGAFIDSYPLLPARKDLIGVPSNAAYFSVAGAPTNYQRWYSDANAPTAGSFTNTALNTIAGTGTQYSGRALRVIADDPISAHSRADSDGCQSAPFLPRSMMRKNYAINVVAEWVKFVSDKPAVVTVTEPGMAPTNITLSKTGTATEALYHFRLTNVPAGTTFESADRMGVWYEPNTTVGAAIEDETILFGWDY